jgi:hypothetical protein
MSLELKVILVLAAAAVAMVGDFSAAGLTAAGARTVDVTVTPLDIRHCLPRGAAGPETVSTLDIRVRLGIKNSGSAGTVLVIPEFVRVEQVEVRSRRGDTLTVGPMASMSEPSWNPVDFDAPAQGHVTVLRPGLGVDLERSIAIPIDSHTPTGNVTMRVGVGFWLYGEREAKNVRRRWQSHGRLWSQKVVSRWLPVTISPSDAQICSQ